MNLLVKQGSSLLKKKITNNLEASVLTKEVSSQLTRKVEQNLVSKATLNNQKASIASISQKEKLINFQVPSKNMFQSNATTQVHVTKKINNVLSKNNKMTYKQIIKQDKMAPISALTQSFTKNQSLKTNLSTLSAVKKQWIQKLGDAKVMSAGSLFLNAQLFNSMTVSSTNSMMLQTAGQELAYTQGGDKIDKDIKEETTEEENVSEKDQEDEYQDEDDKQEIDATELDEQVNKYQVEDLDGGQSGYTPKPRLNPEEYKALQEEKVKKTIYVGNINFNTTEDQLDDFFSEYGEIETVRIAKNKNQLSKGFAHIQFKDAEDQLKVLEAVRDEQFEMDGRVLKVDQARGVQNRPERTGGYGGGGSYGGGDRGGQRGCYKCGQTTHKSYQCPSSGGERSGGAPSTYQPRSNYSSDRGAGGGGGGGYNSDKKSCYVCGQFGHISRDCPKNTGGNGGGGRDRVQKTQVCFKCGQEGHLIKDCPQGGGYSSKY